jgi:hypothetical protein
MKEGEEGEEKQGRRVREMTRVSESRGRAVEERGREEVGIADT